MGTQIAVVTEYLFRLIAKQVEDRGLVGMIPITIFTWGYYGWGNATPQLVQAVDAVDQSRGYEPPIFVDIRIRRSVRAKGFQGSAFEKLLGPTRHRWMKSLGNRYIETRTGPSIQIADPSAADELLDLALENAEQQRRVLFFCSCQFPRNDGETACHRDTVADLVLQAASRKDTEIQVIEWPGGEPRQVDLEVTPEIFKALRGGRVTIPLEPQVDLALYAGLPWGSVVTVRSGDQAMRVVAGPAGYHPGGWSVPVFWRFEMEHDLDAVEEQSRHLRWSCGLEGRTR